MKTRILTLLLLLGFLGVHGQQLIQGSLKTTSVDNEVEVWLQPNFSNNTKYLAQMVFPIAWPATAPHQPTSLTVTLDPTFLANFGTDYSALVAPLAHNTANTENYRSIVLVRINGASSAQTWTSGSEFKVLTVTFNPGNAPGTKVKLADYQDGGSDGQGNFYTASGNSDFYVSSNSMANFYPSTAESLVGGTASAGFVETIDAISLPVHFFRFNGYREGGKNTLQWITADEMNNMGFEVQRSTDGVSYSNIGFVPTQATNGYNTGLLTYTYADNTPAGKKQYYRLRQVDFDKKGKLSNVVMIEGEKPLSLGIGRLYPNPSRTFVNVIINSPYETHVELSILDLSGKVLKRQNEQIGIGSNSVNLDINQLALGTYLIRLNERGSNTFVSTQFSKQ